MSLIGIFHRYTYIFHGYSGSISVIRVILCCIGVGSNSIFCNGCKHWVHKKCSGLKRLKKDPDYRYTWCQGTAWPLDGRPQEVQVGPDKLEVVASFCYLGDMLSAAGGCELSTTTRENRLSIPIHVLQYVMHVENLP